MLFTQGVSVLESVMPNLRHYSYMVEGTELTLLVQLP